MHEVVWGLIFPQGIVRALEGQGFISFGIICLSPFMKRIGVFKILLFVKQTQKCDKYEKFYIIGYVRF